MSRATGILINQQLFYDDVWKLRANKQFEALDLSFRDTMMVVFHFVWHLLGK